MPLGVGAGGILGKTLRRMSQYFWSILVSSGMSSLGSDFRLLMAGCGSAGGMLLFLGFK